MVVGGASWNTVVHVEELPGSRPRSMEALRTYEAAGSTGVGKALNLARLGHEVHLHTLLGDDDNARRVEDTLAAAGVTTHVARHPGPTERHLNLLDPHGGRQSVFLDRAVVPPGLDLRPVADLARECDVVFLNIIGYVAPLVADLGRPFWTDLHSWDGADPHHARFLPGASVVVLGGDVLDDPRTVCRRLAADADLVVCTLGGRGALAFEHGGREHVVPAVDAGSVVDTNGAGDAFAAGLAHGLVAQGWDVARSLRAAALAGATAVTTTALAADTLTAALLATA